jgi:hypothetical protein
MQIIAGEDHGHEYLVENTDNLVGILENSDTADVHGHSGLEALLEVMFGVEHIIAEFFWNGVFIAATFLLTRGIALRKAHKYIDNKHGIDHEEGY